MHALLESIGREADIVVCARGEIADETGGDFLGLQEIVIVTEFGPGYRAINLHLRFPLLGPRAKCLLKGKRDAKGPNAA